MVIVCESFSEASYTIDVDPDACVCVAGPCYKESLDGSSAVAPSGLYSSGSVAGIAIFCVIAALIIGFCAGYYVNSRRYLRCLRQSNDRLWSLALNGKNATSGCGGVVIGGPKRVNQNLYEIDPVKYRIPSINKFDATGYAGTLASSRYIDDDDAFEPILQRSVGLKAGSNAFVDEIKMSNVERAQQIDDELLPPRPPPRRNRSIRKEPDG